MSHTAPQNKVPPGESRRGARRPGAFTLIELLVVIGVIVLLLAILIPALGYATRNAQKAATQGVLQSIVTGLDAYHHEFNVYPDSSINNNYNTVASPILLNGASRLAEALTGYLPAANDGAGPGVANDPLYGFRMSGLGNPRGHIYGPYMQVSNSDYANLSPTNQFFVDSRGYPILYYRASGLANPVNIFKPAGAATSYVFNPDDNPAASLTDQTGKGVTLFDPTLAATAQAAPTLFHTLGSGANSNALGTGDNALGRAGFLLLAPGADHAYFTDDDVVAGE